LWRYIVNPRFTGLFMTNICSENKFWIQIAYIYRLLKLDIFLNWIILYNFDNLMMFVSFFIQLCLVLSMWFVRTKNSVFRGLEGHFWGLTLLGISGYFFRVHDSVLGKNIVFAPCFGPILVQFLTLNHSGNLTSK
jgi:hypothetical protein